MFPELPPAVITLMKDLADGLHKILNSRLVAVYLGGSIVTGDFAETASDLDFLVVIASELSAEDGLAVGLLHRDLRRRHKMAQRLQGDYAPVGLLVPEGTSEPVPGCEQGVFYPRVGEIMLSADNIYNMRAHGLPFYGNPPREVLPAATSDHVRAAVLAMLREGPGRCDTPAACAAEVLDLVRSLCALHEGTPVTKGVGARWALVHLDPQWHPLIRSALAIRHGHGTPEDEKLLHAQMADLNAALRSEYLA